MNKDLIILLCLTFAVLEFFVICFSVDTFKPEIAFAFIFFWPFIIFYFALVGLLKILIQPWQDIERTETSVERIYRTRIDGQTARVAPAF